MTKDKAVPVTGGCGCGAVRYEAEAYLKSGYYCHCRMCQRTSGAPAEIAVPIKPGSLRFLEQEPKFFRSSPSGERGFCPTCGAQMMWRPISTGHDEWTNIAIGCLDHPEHVVPTRHDYVDTQLPWYQLDDGLPRARSDEMGPVTERWKADLN